MKVLIAPDKFKGTLSASQVAAAMAEGVTQFNPDWTVRQMPIADGGEGTAEILTRACGGEMVAMRASDPLFRPIRCEVGIDPEGKTAFIDLSSASGFDSLLVQERDPLRTTTLGTGELVMQAINRKCKRIVIGLGGSSTLDCGMGIAYALGAAFSNEARERLSPIGGNLRKVEFVNLDHLRPELKRVEILLLVDVDNPLLGEEGTLLYAAQKGLAEGDRPRLADALKHFSNLIEAKFGTQSKLAGMGAAGGAALCCVALLGAKIAPGADFVLEALRTQDAIADADLVLTGEGHLDEQSLHGKATVTLSRLAQSQGKHLAAICGQVSLDERSQRNAGIDLATALWTPGDDPQQWKENTHSAIVARTVEVLRELAPRLGG